MRKRNSIWLMAGAVCAIAFCFGCGQKPKEEKIVAKINSYVMTVADLEDEIKHSSYAGDNIEDLDERLDLAIRRQVLIQEAQRQGLDKQKTFMKTIERYWGQTLIKELLENQTRKIQQDVAEDEQNEAIDNWMEQLYKEAEIKIYKNTLKQMKKERQPH